jgi:hypothetical protein
VPDAAARGRAGRRRVLAVKVAALAAFALLLARALGQADWAGTAARLRELGPAALLVALPFPVALALDAAAWKMLLARLGQRAPFARVFRVRVVTESLTTALPAGAVAAEIAGPLLLAGPSGSRASSASSASRASTLAAAFASSTAKRWLIVRAHGYYVGVAFVAGFALLAASSRALVRGPALPWIVLACSLTLVAASFALERAATRLGVASRLHGALARLRASRTLARLGLGAGDVPRDAFQSVDAHLATLGEGAHPVPAGLVLAAWLVESLESFVILRALGVDVDWVTVLSFDAALSVVRSAAVFAPAGLGVQDVGYLAFFEAYGLPGHAAIGPAFLLLKRANQLLWVAAGGLVLVATRALQRRGGGMLTGRP